MDTLRSITEWILSKPKTALHALHFLDLCQINCSFARLPSGLLSASHKNVFGMVTLKSFVLPEGATRGRDGRPILRHRWPRRTSRDRCDELRHPTEPQVRGIADSLREQIRAGHIESAISCPRFIPPRAKTMESVWPDAIYNIEW
jgi:hypothetical protein